MLHDKIYHQARELYAMERYCDNLALEVNSSKRRLINLSKENRTLLPVGMSTVPKAVTGHGAYTTFLMMMTEEPAVGFYFDESVNYNKDMCETGWDFLKNGFLKMPFNTVFFYAKNYAQKLAKEGIDQNKVDEMAIWAKYIPNEEKIIFCDVNGDMNFNYYFFELTKFTSGQPVYQARNPDENGWPSPPRTREIEITGEGLSHILSHFLLLLQHPVYEREIVEIDKSVNDKRVRKGKKSLSKYIYVKMKPHIKAALQSGVGTVRCPHWRRGHVRHISHGRVIPVQACLVNWDGDPTEIQKKVYIK